MTDQVASDGTRIWKSSTALSLLLALAAAGWGWTQYSQIQQLASRVVDLERTLQGANDTIAQANTALQQASRLDLPVSVSFGKRLFNPGLIATFTNNSPSDLEVAAIFTSSATGQEKQTSIVIPASSSREFGSKDGWEFAAGQVVKLSNSKFRTIQYSVPSRN